MNALPLCTPNLYPTISGVIIEARAQVLIGVVLPGFERAKCFKILSWIYGPFLSDRGMVVKSKYKNQNAKLWSHVALA